MIRLSPVAYYQPAFVAALPIGIVAGVHLVPGPEPVPPEVLERLPPEERLFAMEQRGFRQGQFVGGRLALSLALSELGVRRPPILPDGRGAPVGPPGVMMSVSHKQDLAVALVARGADAVGVDIEEVGRPRPGIAARVLRPAELAVASALPEDRAWCDTLVRFSVKEAIYKALDPSLRRYIDFTEVEVWPAPDGADEVRSFLPAEDDRFLIEARHTWLENERVLSTVRVRPRRP